jgi:biopolymer transport protein ExbD
VEDLIRQGKSANPQLAVALVISTWTPWQDVVSFVQMAQKLEIAAFSFSMKEPAGGAL